MDDEVIIRVLRDLPDLVFANGEFPNFKEGDLIRARVTRNEWYGAEAHVNYG